MTASRKGAEASSILPSSSTTTTPPVLGVRSAGRATRSKAARSTPYLPTRGGPGRSTWARTSRAPDTASTRTPSRRPPARSSAVVNPPDRHANLLQQAQQAPGHGGLADPWATLEQQPRGTLVHEVNLADRHRGPRGDRTSGGGMARIDHYEFGRIVVDGGEETNDLIILPDRVMRNWWRQDGHALVLDDLVEVLDDLPSHLVVGTGADGRMRPDPDAVRQLQQRGVTVEALPTGQAVRRFSELDPARTAAA